MKRLWIALALFILTAAIILTGILTVQKYSKELIQKLDLIKQTVINKDFEKAAQLCKQAESKWIKAERKLYLFVDHSEISEIGLTIAKLEPLLISKDFASFFAELKIAQIQLLHIAQMESISAF